MRTRRKFNPGDRIGGWTLLEYPYQSKKVLVRCDCGFEAWRWLANFSSGKSVGCTECRKGDPAEKTFKHTKAIASRRGIEWLLSFDEWKALASKNCKYCGVEPTNMIAVYGYAYNGIDRVNSSGIYEPNNVVPCCKVCNRAKSNMDENEFYEWIGRVYGRAKTLH